MCCQKILAINATFYPDPKENIFFYLKDIFSFRPNIQLLVQVSYSFIETVFKEKKLQVLNKGKNEFLIREYI